MFWKKTRINPINPAPVQPILTGIPLFQTVRVRAPRTTNIKSNHSPTAQKFKYLKFLLNSSRELKELTQLKSLRDTRDTLSKNTPNMISQADLSEFANNFGRELRLLAKNKKITPHVYDVVRTGLAMEPNGLVLPEFADIAALKNKLAILNGFMENDTKTSYNHITNVTEVGRLTPTQNTKNKLRELQNKLKLEGARPT